MASDLSDRNEAQGLPISAGSFEKERRKETPSVKRSIREGFTFIIGAVSSDLNNRFGYHLVPTLTWESSSLEAPTFRASYFVPIWPKR